MASAALCWRCPCLQSVTLALHSKREKIEIRMGVSAGLLFLKPSFFGHESFSMGFLILKVIVQAKL